MYIIPAILLLVLSIATPAIAQQETIRILMLDNLPSVTLDIPDDYCIKDTGEETALDGGSTDGKKLVLDGREKSPEAVRINASGSVVNINAFALTGMIDIRKNKKGSYQVINELGLEDYVRAVVGEEMSSRWPLEALKAQAVIARTYALYRKSKSTSSLYDLSATVDSQMFTGDARDKQGPAAAARDTAGEVLTYEGEVIETVYHSACGGETEKAKDVWDRDYPYLKSQDCPCGKESPYARWEKTFAIKEIERALAAGGYSVSGISRIRILDRSDTKRVKMVKVSASSGSINIKGIDFRRLLGYSKLPSTAFEVRKEDSKFIFSGKGSGHGVGLCQWGAKVMADEGKGYREILEHYYPGTVLVNTNALSSQAVDTAHAD